MISLMKAAERLGICVGSAKESGAQGDLASDANFAGFTVARSGRRARLRGSPIGVQRVVDRRPKFYEDYQYDKLIRLPGI